jgi:PAS domain S-box-containing protein
MDDQRNPHHAPEPEQPPPAPLPGRSRLQPYLVALTAWILLAALGCLAGGRWYQGYLVGKQRLSALNLLSSKATALSAAINRRLALLEGLHTFSEANAGAPDFGRRFAVYAAGLHAGARDVRIFAIAPGGVIRYLYPTAGNEVAQGLDLFRDPHTREDALRTLRSRGVTLSAPYELRQGGLGLVARQAVYARGRIWALATMGLDVPAVLAEAGLDNGNRLALALALRDRTGTVFHGEPAVFAAQPVLLAIDIPEGRWDLAAVPKGGWEASTGNDLLLFYAATCCGALGLACIIFLTLNRQRRLREAVDERTRALKREHRFAVGLIDSLPGVFYLYDDNMKFLRWNRNLERVLGYAHEEIAELSPLDLFAGPDRELLQGKIQEVFARGASQVEAEFRCKSGATIPYFFTGVKTEIDGRSCLIGIGIDISERKRLERELTEVNASLETRVEERTRELQESRRELEQLVRDLNLKGVELTAANEKLQEVDRLKSMFIASMSHELRTPLNSVIGYSSIILNEWLGPLLPLQHENLAVVLRAGKHLLSLINDVIDVSKIEAGQIEVRPEEFDLFDLVTEATEQLEPEIRRKGLELRVGNLHLAMLADRRRLLQATLNLLSNAMKYTEAGSIEIAVRQDGTLVEIAVTDTGIGIAAEDAELIFRPFQRLDSALRGTVSGTGLGLYLTSKLVTEILGGTVGFTSQPGKGSTFTLRLPVRAGAQPAGSGR